MLRLADLIESNLDELARAESVDSGKPVSLARTVDIPRAAANFRFFATAILHAHTEAYRTDGLALDPAELDGAITMYFELADWDVETGVPRRETLEEVGLGWLADEAGA